VITHDPTDAAVLADRLVVIENGRVVQTGTPQEVARRPRTDYVARLSGLNLLPGVGVEQDGEQGRERSGEHGVRLADGSVITVPSPVAGAVFAAFRPSAAALWRTRPDGSPRNVWSVVVRGLEPYGDSVRVELESASDLSFVAEVTPAAVADLGLAIGDRLWATVKASEIEVYPR
jgi:molybdate transport system ATP-binding protein